MEGWTAANGLKVCGAGGATSDQGGAGLPSESGDAEWLMVHTEVEGGRSRGRGGTEELVGYSDDWMAGIAEDWGRDWRPTQKLLKRSIHNISLERWWEREAGQV